LTGFNELREKYTFNIKPFQITSSTVDHSKQKNLNTNNNNEEIDRMISCFSLLQQYPLNNKQQPQLLFNKKTVKKK
jgi:hypothetical protein